MIGDGRNLVFDVSPVASSATSATVGLPVRRFKNAEWRLRVGTLHPERFVRK